MTRHTTYPKFRCRGVIVLSYGRSRYFTILFFMLKISITRTCENNKSCSIFHHESYKIGFAIFWIIDEFLRILQVSANLQHYWSYSFALRPLEVSADLRPCPYFAQNSPNKSQTLQCRPRAPTGGGPAKFRRTAGRGRLGAGGDWPLAPRGPIPGLGCGGGAVEVGAPAASGGGRRGRCAGEVGLCGGRRARRRAKVGTREGGSELGLGVQPAGARACRGCLHWHRRRPSVCTGTARGI
jgi:hypothetical protein